MTFAYVLAVIFLVDAVLLGRMAARAKAGTLPRNALMGVRTTRTLASDEAWRIAHAAAWRHFLVAAIIMGLTGLGALLLAVFGGPTWAVAIVALAAVVGALIPTVFAVRAANRGLDAAGRAPEGDEASTG